MEYLTKIIWQWEDMCGPGGLQVWNATTRDLGVCFQNICFDIPTLLLLAIVSGYYVGFNSNWIIRGKLQENAIQFRCAVVLCLAFLPVIYLYVSISQPFHTLLPVDYFLAGMQCLSWLVHFGYVLALRTRLGRSPRGPVGVLVVWSLIVVLNVISLRSSILYKKDFYFELTICVLQLFYLVSLFPSEGISNATYYSHCLVGSQYSQLHEHQPLLREFMEDEGILGTAMQGANKISKMFFFWVEPLFLRGMEKKLKMPDDLFDLPPGLCCSYINHRIDKALIGNVDKYQNIEAPTPFRRKKKAQSYGSMDTGSSSSVPKVVLLPALRKHNVTLIRGLHTCFGIEFYAIGFLKLMADLAGFGGPLLLNKLITYVEDPSVEVSYGYFYAGGLLLVTIVNAFCSTHFTMGMTLIGIKFRAAIVSTVLRKILSVSSTTLNKEFTFGEITNFMSTDADRIVNSCPSFHALWSIPFQLFFTLYLLYMQIGISFLAGVIFSIILIPINKAVANKIGQLSTDMMRHKDNRVSIMGEIIRGIRAIKLHVWEDHFTSKVSRIRNMELKYLRKRKYLDAVCVFFWATTPVLVTTLTLCTYVLLGNNMSAATIFTSLALMNMLIGPLNAFPWVLNGLTEAWVSIKRIQNLLNLPDLNNDLYYDNITSKLDNQVAINIVEGEFSWAKAIPKKKTNVQAKRPKKDGQGQRKVLNIQRHDSSDSSQESIIVGSGEPFSLTDLCLTVKGGDLIGVIGKVGSGKSSLLHAILGEMIKKDGEITLAEDLLGFGYVSQKPWLQRGTVKDNILFGKAYDDAKFRNVVEACGLTEDLSLLGQNAAVGEGGCTLSGGQKARIALARAVYQDKEVYLLDDVLSSVDMNMAVHIFRKCITGLLKHKTRILVTHASQYLPQMNLIIVMDGGKIIRQGPPSQILNNLDEGLLSDTEHSDDDHPSVTMQKEMDNVSLHSNSDRSINSIMNKEDSATGEVDLWVLGMYWKSIGHWLALVTLLALLVMQTSRNVTDLWLSYWVASMNPANSTNSSQILAHAHSAESPSVLSDFLHGLLGKKNQSDHATMNNSIDIPIYELRFFARNSTSFYLYIYCGLALSNAVFTLLRAFLFAYGGIQAATKIHRSLLKTIMRAKIKFFDITPAGRMLNRFSSDVYTVDDSLPFILNILLAQVFGLLGSLVVTVYGLPWLCLILVPLMPIYHWLQHRYRVTSRELKRLYSVALSPIYAHFNDALLGVTTIRAFKSTSRYMSVIEHLVDCAQRASFSSAAASQWLFLRLQIMGVMIIGGSAIIAVAQRHFNVADPGLIGLAIAYALSVTSLLGGVMNAFPETERELISVERIGQYIKQIEPEGKTRVLAFQPPIPPPYGWPTQGVVHFDHVVMKYRDHLSPALKEVSFETRPAEKIGIVGRTGAGKSSLLAALFRLSEINSGYIRIDNVDICSISLGALRSRLAVIPQDPFVFNGTIRENLDPLGQYLESEIWSAVEKCSAKGMILEKGGLAAPAEDLSQGHMQLLCLARAVLQSAKVICIDEATANVDQETDRIIQEAIRCSFRKSTVITIAHRISTILDCERVLVMGDGEILEFDSPDVLMQDRHSHFYHLVHSEDAE